MKNISLFKIIATIIIITTLFFIIVANIIEKTNIENKLYEDQKQFFEKYVSEKSSSKTILELLSNLELYIDNKYKNPEVIPTVEFYGTDNDNCMLLYSAKDELQRDNYKKEIKSAKSKIKENDTFFVICEYDDNNEYVRKIVIEKNY